MVGLISVLLCASTLTIVAASPHTLCPSQGNIVNLEVGGCSDDISRCILKRGTNVSIEMTFTPGEDVADIEAEAFGLLFQNLLPVPYAIPSPDGCKNSNLKCPLKKDDEVTYSQSFAVLPFYPQMKLTVNWLLRNPSTGHLLVCANIPVEIK